MAAWRRAAASPTKAPMARPLLRSKPDPIPASAFAGMCAESLNRLCSDTAASNPRFSLAIAKMGAPLSPFVSSSRRHGGFIAQKSAFFHALEAGHLGYARLLAARLDAHARARNSTAAQAVESHGSTPAFHNQMFLAILSSGLADDKVLRARGWLWRRLGCAGSKLPVQLDFEARAAFAHGRPAAALSLCRELALLDGRGVSRATSGRPDLPAGAASIALPIAPGGRVKNLAFRSLLPNDSGGRTGDADSASRASFDQAALLCLGAFWESKLAAAQPTSDGGPGSLSRQIGLAMDDLWAMGACSSPADSARRFARAPYLAGSPQALALALASSASGFPLALAPLWVAAAERPEDPCGSSILWDAFVSAHEGLGPVGPNPFALLPSGQAAALWSLAGDGKLIALGLARGYDPKPIQHLLVHPGATGELVRTQGSSLRAADARHALAKSYQSHPACQGVFIDKERGPKARRPVPGSTDEPTQWMRSNLASLALFSGHPAAASALAAAGCDVPDPALATAEAGDHQSLHQIALGLSLFEQLRLRDAIAPPTPPPGAAPKKRL